MFSYIPIDSTNYSILKQDILINKKKMFFSTFSINKLQYFLSEDFLFDIDFESAEDIVKMYGTHVLTDITIGGKLSIYMSGQEQEKKGDLIKFSDDFVYYYLNKNSSFFKVDTNLKFVNLHLVQHGGIQIDAVSTIIEPKEVVDPELYNWSEFNSSLTDNNYTLISSDLELLIPIWEFILDENKKNEVINYIKGK